MYVNECYEGRLRKTFIFSTRLLYLDTTVGPFLVLVHQSLSRRLVHQCKCPLTVVVGNMAGPGVVHEPLLHVVFVFLGHACIISKTYKQDRSVAHAYYTCTCVLSLGSSRARTISEPRMDAYKLSPSLHSIFIAAMAGRSTGRIFQSWLSFTLSMYV